MRKLRHQTYNIAITVLTVLLLCTMQSRAQDSTSASVADTLIHLPLKYFNQIDNKIDKYSNRIISKTEKTLTRLSKWENKIKALLQKANPEAAERLFGNNQTTFSTLLQKLQEGKTIAENYELKYDEYRDKLRSSVSYLQQQKDALKTKVIDPLKQADEKLTALEDNIKNSEALQQFIKERKKKLIDQSIQYIGNSKYLQKIAKENYYYVETLRNYKELFHDEKKAEQVALTLLNKIPAFTKFIEQNSMLAKLFGPPGGPIPPSGGGGALAGLQTRASVQQNLINRFGVAAFSPPSGGVGGGVMQQNFQQAQTELSKLKDKILKAGGSSGDMEIPDFKPNETKTKTFKQRLEFGTNLQTQKATNFFPNRTDIGLSLGYKLGNKSIIGIGASYSLGLGRGWNNIRISSEGASARTFLESKIKGSFFLSGAYELNYREQIRITNGVVAPPSGPARAGADGGWGPQQSGLLGISKTVSVKSKLFKKTSVKLLWDFMSYRQIPRSQPIIFRVGYGF
jgi:hypothetical protein